MKILWGLLLLLPALARAGDFDKYEEWQALKQWLVTTHNVDAVWLEQVGSEMTRLPSVLEAISRPAEKTREWKDYRPLFLTDARIQGGVAFWQAHRAALERAAQNYGVAPEMIVAIIGVETKYGSNKGKYRALDSLATLAFDYPPRAPFFRSELSALLQLAQAGELDALSAQGSYAGAMGYGQFMPSNIQKLAVDFDGDDKIDLFNSADDAIGSVANYFRFHGWQQAAPVVERVHIVGQDYDNVYSDELKPVSTVGDIADKGLLAASSWPRKMLASALRLQGENGAEFWLAFDNFYVISKYNRSKLYAMAAWQLSQEIRQAYDLAQAAALNNAAAPDTTGAAGP